HLPSDPDIDGLVKVKSEAGAISRRKSRVVLLVKQYPQVDFCRTLWGKYNFIAAENILQEAVLHIESGQQIVLFSSNVVCIASAGVNGVKLILKIRPHLFVHHQFSKVIRR